MELSARLTDFQGVVLCLDASSRGNASFLAAGTEDGRVHLWDMARRERVAEWRISNTDEASCVRFHPSRPVLFAAAGRHVFALDLTAPASNSVAPAPDASQPWLDDIESIDVHSNGQHLVTADASGAVWVCEYETKAPAVFIKSVQKFRNRTHDNIATGVRFRPTKPWEALSVGMDCQVMQWDFAAKHLVSNFAVSADTDESGRMINPPLMYALDMSKDGKLLAVALGDGSVLAMTPRRKAKRLSDWMNVRLTGQHSRAVTTMCAFDSY